MLDPKLENLIELLLSDGQLTEKKKVLNKKFPSLKVNFKILSLKDWFRIFFENIVKSQILLNIILVYCKNVKKYSKLGKKLSDKFATLIN